MPAHTLPLRSMKISPLAVRSAGCGSGPGPASRAKKEPCTAASVALEQQKGVPPTLRCTTQGAAAAC